MVLQVLWITLAATSKRPAAEERLEAVRVRVRSAGSPRSSTEPAQRRERRRTAARVDRPRTPDASARNAVDDVLRSLRARSSRWRRPAGRPGLTAAAACPSIARCAAASAGRSASRPAPADVGIAAQRAEPRAGRVDEARDRRPARKGSGASRPAWTTRTDVGRRCARPSRAAGRCAARGRRTRREAARPAWRPPARWSCRRARRRCRARARRRRRRRAAPRAATLRPARRTSRLRPAGVAERMAARSTIRPSGANAAGVDARRRRAASASASASRVSSAGGWRAASAAPARC